MEKNKLLEGVEALENLIHALRNIQSDAVRFIADRGLTKEFLKFHTEKCIEREAQRHGQNKTT